jgi:two-component system LytT family response regulator
MQTKVVIVEDEFAARERVIQLLARHFPQLEIVAAVDSVPAAVTAIRTHLPQLVFLDIEIKMGSGFDVLRQLEDLAFDMVFLTAFDNYAVDGFRYNAVDYLLKPLQKELLIEAVSRYFARRQEHAPFLSSNTAGRGSEPQASSRISIATQEGLDFLPMSDILYAEASGSYTKLIMQSGSPVLVTKRISEMEEKLGAEYFLRIHNSYIVNLRYVKKYLRGRGGSLVMFNGDTLPVSLSRKDEFLKRME